MRRNNRALYRAARSILQDDFEAKDVTLTLTREPRVSAYVVAAENFESIHNHSAFARIARTCLAVGPARSGKREDQHLHLLSTESTR